jgi:hypothetical protein
MLDATILQVKSMAKGRAEVLGLVARRKYSELMERDLADRKLQRSILDIRSVGGSRCWKIVPHWPGTPAI